MYTFIESARFTRAAQKLLTEDDLSLFYMTLTLYPESGTVVPASGGCRKIRWTRPGAGKRGGTRVIYFNQLARGRIYLLDIYAKSTTDNIPPKLLRELKHEIESNPETW